MMLDVLLKTPGRSPHLSLYGCSSVLAPPLFRRWTTNVPRRTMTGGNVSRSSRHRVCKKARSMPRVMSLQRRHARSSRRNRKRRSARPWRALRWSNRRAASVRQSDGARNRRRRGPRAWGRAPAGIAGANEASTAKALPYLLLPLLLLTSSLNFRIQRLANCAGTQSAPVKTEAAQHVNICSDARCFSQSSCWSSCQHGARSTHEHLQ